MASFTVMTGLSKGQARPRVGTLFGWCEMLALRVNCCSATLAARVLQASWMPLAANRCWKPSKTRCQQQNELLRKRFCGCLAVKCRTCQGGTATCDQGASIPQAGTRVGLGVSTSSGRRTCKPLALNPPSDRGRLRRLLLAETISRSAPLPTSLPN